MIRDELDIEVFKAENDWTIEKLWNKEEKSALGIFKNDNLYSIDDFKRYLQSLLDEMTYILSEISEVNSEPSVTYRSF